MKRMLMGMMAVAVAIAFSAPAFAGEEKKEMKITSIFFHVLYSKTFTYSELKEKRVT